MVGKFEHESTERNETHEVVAIKTTIRNYLAGTTGLYRTVRWRKDKEQEDPFISAEEVKSRKESLMEHVGAMQVLFENVYSLAETFGDESVLQLDYRKIIQLIILHDLPEVVPDLGGDVRVSEKDSEYYKKEQEAIGEISERMSEVPYGEKYANLLKDYHNKNEETGLKNTPEERFVKALDDLQAMFYMMNFGCLDMHDRDYSNENYLNVAGCASAEEFATLKKIMDIARSMINRKELIDFEVKQIT